MRSVVSSFVHAGRRSLRTALLGMVMGGAVLHVGAARADDNGNLVLQLLERVNTLEEQTRDMRGQIDQLNNQVQQQNATLSKQIADMNFAMQNGHGGASGGAASAASTAAAGAAPLASADGAAPAKRTAADILKDGNAALLRQDYTAAQADAQQVLSGPKSVRQIDAQYLLAQSLAGQKQYRQSALAYYDTYTVPPMGLARQVRCWGLPRHWWRWGTRHPPVRHWTSCRVNFQNLSPASAVRKASIAKRRSAAVDGSCQ